MKNALIILGVLGVAILCALLLVGCAAGTHSGTLHYQNAAGQVLNYDYKNVAAEKGHPDTPQKFDDKGNPNFGVK